MQYLEEVDHTSSEFGELYDELPLWSAPFGLLLLARVPLRPGLIILDVGAGTGFLTIELAQRCGATSTVIAVDPWAAGMRRLRRKLAQLSLANVQLLDQDAAALDLPDASIDLVVSNLGINNFANAEAVLQTCFRVTKPAGRLVLTTNLVGHLREFYDVYRITLRELGLTDCLATLETHINHRATCESVVELLEHTGFEGCAVIPDAFQMRFANGSSFLRHTFVRLAFMPGWKGVVPADAVVRTFALLERKLNAAAAEHGELALSIPMAYVEARKPQGAAGRPGLN